MTKDMKAVQEILQHYDDFDSLDYDILNELFFEIRDYFELNPTHNYSMWAWDAYGDKELRYYVLENDTCVYAIYPFRREIKEINKPIREVDEYFADEMLH